MKGRKPDFLKQTQAASILALLTSSGTLVCCALPALLVGLGAGAALSTVIAAVPQLVWFSEHKLEVFGAAALMLAGAGVMQWRAQRLPCPLEFSQTCTRMRRLSLAIYGVSMGVFLAGGFFAFVLPVLIFD